MTALSENPFLAELEAARLSTEISVATYVKAIDDSQSHAVVELLRLDLVRDGRRLLAAEAALKGGAA